MKHSIFLFLLFFAFSTSDDFEIIMKSGIQLWEISDNSIDTFKYERFDLPNEESVRSHVDSSAEPSGVSEPGILQQRMNPDNTFRKERMDTCNTYVILKIDRRFQFFMYYWVGAQSSQEKRISGAHLAGYIFMEIYKKIPRKNLKKFHREAEGHENVSFLRFINEYREGIEQRLYRIAGTKGQFIMEVPLTPSQLNGSDTFVLQKRQSAFIWNSLHSNPYIRCKAYAFGVYIFNMESKKRHHYSPPPMLLREGYTDRESDFYESFRVKFFEDINANEEEKRFPNLPYYYTDEELENKRREDVKLYRFSNKPHDFTPHEVPYRDLKLSDLDEKATHVLVDLNCGNTYVIIGHQPGLISVQNSLSFAETFYRSMRVENAWQRVKIIRLSEDLPMYFQIYFSDSRTSKNLKFIKQ